jgi:hypothetical protein
VFLAQHGEIYETDSERKQDLKKRSEPVLCWQKPIRSADTTFWKSHERHRKKEQNSLSGVWVR